ncbi:MAG: glycoside hydrolase family 28 protein [Pseudomonadota bacterium]|nr:glycoside hydrolase family 28 protein [Pseudomonadota bacterium]
MTAMINQHRRTLLRGASAASVWLAAGAGAGPLAVAATPADPWARAQQIIDRFATPRAFRDEDFAIGAFGALPCQLIAAGAARMTPAPQSPDCYGAIAAAIAACNQAGGGRVLIPAGTWYCAGPMVLRSNVHVHLAAGAQIYFSANPAHYAKYGDIDCGERGKLVLSRWQGNDVLNYSPMVYACNQSNIALTGADWTSVLNGQGSVPFEQGGGCWHDWAGKNKQALQTAGKANPLNPASLATVAPQLSASQRALIEGVEPDWRSDARFLPALSEAGVPVARRQFGIGHYLRPCMIEFIGCTDVLMQGYQVVDTPFWQHHPVNCRNVHIRNVKMDSMGPNSDGFDPESCDTVLVDGCEFNTGDDCIAIKSGKNRDTREGPTRNVVIQNCIMNSGHGGITLGSEMAAGIEHVYAQHVEFRNVHWATNALGTAIRMKTNMNRGGFLRHFYVRDVAVPNGVTTSAGFYTPLPGSAVAPKSASTGGGAVITIDCDYAVAQDAVRTRPPSVSDVHISNLRVGNVKTADGEFSCYQAMVLLGPVATSFNGPAGTPVLPLIDISITDCDFGTPRNGASHWFIHNVQRLALKNVRIGGKTVSATLSA